MDELRRFANDVETLLRQTGGTQNVRNNLGLPTLDVKAIPRQEALNFYQISVPDFAQQTRMLMTNDKVGKYVLGGIEEDIDIQMGYAWPSRQGKIGAPTAYTELLMLSTITPNGQLIPLSSLAEFELSQSALSILHKDGKRTITVLADTKGRTAGEILNDIRPTLQEWQDQWPEGYEFHFAGEAESSDELFGSAGKMLILALFLVFALLVLQFDSFMQPLIIMAAIPLALTGTFLGFFLLHFPFSFMAMIGVIALIGIVVNDTIVMIETMNEHRQSGKSTMHAAAHGAADRLRPILTTSVTTIVGMIPLAFSNKMWLPLATTVISGLLFATVLALLVVPCLYRLLTSSKPYTEPTFD